MTETSATPTTLRIPRPRTDALTRRDAGTAPITPSSRRRVRLALPAWLPRAVLRRGATPTREDARALHDLRAVQDRSDW
ncbi:hypothetical protein ACTJI8_00975 [Microbacterium sp. 22303]|uniref:hypothetical protein n=1 Tax=Microbacterium sp. 22303 TaxID=3453905 RepID=UPI003F8266DB